MVLATGRGKDASVVAGMLGLYTGGMVVVTCAIVAQANQGAGAGNSCHRRTQVDRLSGYLDEFWPDMARKGWIDGTHS